MSWFSRLRQWYWGTSTLAGQIAGVFRPGNEDWRRYVVRQQVRFLFGALPPAPGEARTHLRAAVDWLLRAQAATPDEGVSMGYFPYEMQSNGWRPSYPETTGYIITSLLNFADRCNDKMARDAALRMAYWETRVQMPSGAVQGGVVSEASQQTAAAFNTGMALDGWCSAFQATGSPDLLEAGRRAADFLVGDLDADSYFRTNGAYVRPGEIKTYTCLCAWAMHRFGEVSGNRLYQDAAIRVIEAALRQQQSNGWFAHNCLTRSHSPLTHTLGYTLQGVLEVGVAAQRPDFVAAARKGVDPMLSRIDRRGLMAGRFNADWTPGNKSSCLTGNAQIAIVCYRLYELTGASAYKQAADALIGALKALQDLETPNPGLSGAIAGSFPPFGEYMRAGYPNWAAKYFIDALLLQQRLVP